MTHVDREQGRLSRAGLMQRLVGILVLIALAVIIVPMTLDLRKDHDRITETNIPERPAGLRVEVMPLPAPSKETAGLLTQLVPIRSEGSEPESAPGSPSVEAPAAAESPVAKAATPALPSATGLPAPDAWVVQLGSFSSEENAVTLRDRLRQRGYVAFVDKVRVGDQAVTRVQVGPEAQKARSEQVRDRLEKELDLKGIVVSYGR